MNLYFCRTLFHWFWLDDFFKHPAVTVAATGNVCTLLNLPFTCWESCYTFPCLWNNTETSASGRTRTPLWESLTHCVYSWVGFWSVPSDTQCTNAGSMPQQKPSKKVSQKKRSLFSCFFEIPRKHPEVILCSVLFAVILELLCSSCAVYTGRGWACRPLNSFVAIVCCVSCRWCVIVNKHVQVGFLLESSFCC